MSLQLFINNLFAYIANVYPLQLYSSWYLNVFVHLCNQCGGVIWPFLASLPFLPLGWACLLYAHVDLKHVTFFLTLQRLIAFTGTKRFPWVWDETLDFLNNVGLLILLELDWMYFPLWGSHEVWSPGVECCGLTLKWPHRLMFCRLEGRW